MVWGFFVADETQMDYASICRSSETQDNVVGVHSSEPAKCDPS
jgi:proteasome lid subunit RPN8/RPN11